MTEKRVALVTGASRGIGAELAVRLAADGYHLILAARTEAGLVETEDRIFAAGGSATIVPIDLTRGEESDRLAAVVAERFGRLDLLVLNAATLGVLSPLAHATPKEFESVIQLNLVAQWRLMRNFDPLLRLAGGTVVAVTSSVGSRPHAYWGAYAISKAGLEHMAALYAEEMRNLGVKVLVVDPGGTRTAMRARAYPGEDPNSVKAPDLVAVAVAEALPRLGAGLSRLSIDRQGEARLAA